MGPLYRPGGPDEARFPGAKHARAVQSGHVHESQSSLHDDRRSHRGDRIRHGGPPRRAGRHRADRRERRHLGGGLGRIHRPRRRVRRPCGRGRHGQVGTGRRQDLRDALEPRPPFAHPPPRRSRARGPRTNPPGRHRPAAVLQRGDRGGRRPRFDPPRRRRPVHRDQPRRRKLARTGLRRPPRPGRRHRGVPPAARAHREHHRDARGRRRPRPRRLASTRFRRGRVPPSPPRRHARRRAPSDPRSAAVPRRRQRRRGRRVPHRPGGAGRRRRGPASRRDPPGRRPRAASPASSPTATCAGWSAPKVPTGCNDRSSK